MFRPKGIKNEVVTDSVKLDGRVIEKVSHARYLGTF